MIKGTETQTSGCWRLYYKHRYCRSTRYRPTPQSCIYGSQCRIVQYIVFPSVLMTVSYICLICLQLPWSWLSCTTKPVNYEAGPEGPGPLAYTREGTLLSQTVKDGEKDKSQPEPFVSETRDQKISLWSLGCRLQVIWPRHNYIPCSILGSGVAGSFPYGLLPALCQTFPGSG